MIRSVWAVARITIAEALWKKQIYILFLVLAAIFAFFSRLEFFNLGLEASFIKVIPITGTALFGVIIGILAAARQLPEERAQRTILPMLAKPVTRLRFLIGKFVGVGLVVSIAMVAVAAVFCIVLLMKNVDVNRVFWQAILLQILQVLMMVALTIALSTVLSHAATVVIALLLFYLLSGAGATMEDMLYMGGLPLVLVPLYRALLLLLPRLDLFNISKAVLHDAEPQPWTVVLPFVAYAFLFCAAFLVLGALLFRKKDL